MLEKTQNTRGCVINFRSPFLNVFFFLMFSSPKMSDLDYTVLYVHCLSLKSVFIFLCSRRSCLCASQKYENQKSGELSSGELDLVHHKCKSQSLSNSQILFQTSQLPGKLGGYQDVNRLSHQTLLLLL